MIISFSNFWEDAGAFYWIFAGLACLIAIFGILPDLFRDREMSGGLKALWLIFLILVPVIGVIVYLIVRGRQMGERRLKDFDEDMAASDRAGGGEMPINQIALAKQMLDSGAITQDEFDKLRAEGNA
jgi:uncharacterized membrane protein